MLEQDFYDQLQVSKVGQQYLALVKQCKSRVLVPEAGFEIHHIFPTSLGGNNVELNKVKVSVFEHCKLHALLAQAIPCYKTLQPLIRMTYGQVKKLTDVERLGLEEVYHWAKLREKALHHPKSPELVEKNRLGHLGKKMSSEHVRKRTAQRKGTITVTDGQITKYIKPNYLSEYLKLGWTRGIGEVRRKKLRSSHSGIKGNCKGRVVMHKDNREIKIYPKDVPAQEKKGWKRGRAPIFTEKRAASMRNKTNAGKIRVNKGGVGKLVSKDELSTYLNQGWVLGMAK